MINFWSLKHHVVSLRCWQHHERLSMPCWDPCTSLELCLMLGYTDNLITDQWSISRRLCNVSLLCYVTHIPPLSNMIWSSCSRLMKPGTNLANSMICWTSSVNLWAVSAHNSSFVCTDSHHHHHICQSLSSLRPQLLIRLHRQSSSSYLSMSDQSPPTTPDSSALTVIIIIIPVNVWAVSAHNSSFVCTNSHHHHHTCRCLSSLRPQLLIRLHRQSSSSSYLSMSDQSPPTTPHSSTPTVIIIFLHRPMNACVKCCCVKTTKHLVITTNLFPWQHNGPYQLRQLMILTCAVTFHLLSSLAAWHVNCRVSTS